MTVPRPIARFLRYAVGSGLATLVSAVAFALAYRTLAQGPRIATGAAFLSGAAVNFTASRYWTWNRRDRTGLGRDAVSYAVLALVAALAAGVSTSVTHALLHGADPDRRAVLVEASYFGTYALLFVVKFVVLDRVVFRSHRQVPSTTRA